MNIGKTLKDDKQSIDIARNIADNADSEDVHKAVWKGETGEVLTSISVIHVGRETHLFIKEDLLNTFVSFGNELTVISCYTASLRDRVEPDRVETATFSEEFGFLD
jgi:hypothetical protein